MKLLYAFFWVIPRRLNFICRRFGTFCLFHLHRRCKYQEFLIRTCIQHSQHGESLKSSNKVDDSTFLFIDKLTVVRVY